MFLTHTPNGGWVYSPEHSANAHSISDARAIRECPVCSALEPVYVDETEGREDPTLACPVCDSQELHIQYPDYGPDRVIRCQDCAWDYAD